MSAIDFHHGDEIDAAGVQALVTDAVLPNAITKQK
jgi:hypothetical protein